MKAMNIFRIIPFLSNLFYMHVDEPGAGGAAAVPSEAPGAAQAAPPPPAGTVAPAADDGAALTLETPPAKPEPEAESPYEPTGDPALDLTLSWLASKGIGADDPALANAQKGDFALLEAKLSLMGDKAKGWETYLALGKKAYNDAKVAATARVTATKADIIKVVGSEDTWNKVREWASAAVDTDAERTAISNTLRGGGVAAKAMAVYLHTMFNKANPSGPASVVKDDAGPGRNQGGAPMSARAYSDAVAALARTLGRDPTGSPEYAALGRQRATARAMGY